MQDEQHMCSRLSFILTTATLQLSLIPVVCTQRALTMAISYHAVSDIIGYEGRKNTMIVCVDDSQLQEKNQLKRHIIFFGGDVQNIRAEMEAHRDNWRYADWSLEDTSRLLHSKFPNSLVWIVRPAKMTLKTFSVYSNFIQFDAQDIPKHSPGQNSWKHLSRLLESAVARLMSGTELSGVSSSGDSKSCDSKAPCQETDLKTLSITPGVDTDLNTLLITLIGFSKGCTVLNQLLYDYPTDSEDEKSLQFIQRVDEVIWLDGGHNGQENIWVTDLKILRPIAQLQVNFSAFVTPYQINDARSPWKGKQYKKFVTAMREVKASFKTQVFFEDEEPTLENHFKILGVFV